MNAFMPGTGELSRNGHIQARQRDEAKASLRRRNHVVDANHVLLAVKSFASGWPKSLGSRRRAWPSLAAFDDAGGFCCRIISA
jgi:hypothetical protein